MNKKRIALVCGSSKGMGLAIAQKLASDGIKVLMIARNADALKKQSEMITNNGNEAHFLVGDVTNKNLPLLSLKECFNKWGKYPDILINNAGGPKAGTILDLEDEDWDASYQLCLMSFIRFTRAVIPHMKENKWGRIVNITSTVAKEPSPTMAMSAAFRAGVSALTKAFSMELAVNNITINTICPGGVSTDRLISLLKQSAKKTNKNFEELMTASQNGIPIKRFAEPEEIANVASFLASQEASYVTGTSLDVDGGLTRSYF